MYVVFVCITVYSYYFYGETYSHYQCEMIFFPVDSTAHSFMFNLTPCSTKNKPVWKAALTWIPSECLLTRQLYSGNAENDIQLKN